MRKMREGARRYEKMRGWCEKVQEGERVCFKHSPAGNWCKGVREGAGSMRESFKCMREMLLVKKNEK